MRQFAYDIRNVVLAVLFFLIFGVVQLVIGRTWTGITLLGIGVFITAFSLAEDVGPRLLVVTMAAAVCSGGLVYFAAASEISGKSVYYYMQRRVVVGEAVTREASPAKFRQSTNLKWGVGTIAAGIAVAAFLLRRHLEESELF
jgi:hypothetical protein